MSVPDPLLQLKVAQLASLVLRMISSINFYMLDAGVSAISQLDWSINKRVSLKV